MNGAEQLVETDSMLHRQNILGEHLAGIVGHDRDPENVVLARLDEQFHEASVRAFCDRAVEMADVVSHCLIGNALL